APPSARSTLSLHDALPIYARIVDELRLRERGPKCHRAGRWRAVPLAGDHRRLRFVELLRVRVRGAGVVENPEVLAGLVELRNRRSEEHTSELQSRSDLVCR